MLAGTKDSSELIKHYCQLRRSRTPIEQALVLVGHEFRLRQPEYQLDVCCEVSCPQLLDAPLRTIQLAVDQERVGVGRYLRRDPGSQPDERDGQSLAQAKDPLEARDGDLYVLPRPVAPFRALSSQEDANLFQGLPQILASVGQISQELPRHFVSQSRLVEEFLGQGDICDVGGGEFVGDGDAVGGAQEVQLNPIDAEGTPTSPRGSIETR